MKRFSFLICFLIAATAAFSQDIITINGKQYRRLYGPTVYNFLTVDSVLNLPVKLHNKGERNGALWYNDTRKTAYLKNGADSIPLSDVDSIFIVDGGSNPDTLKYRKLATIYIAGLIQGGGSGTVTSFSSGNLTDFFTTSVANATTTPALSFTIANTSQYRVWGRSASGTGSPSYVTIDTSFITDFYSKVRSLFNTTYPIQYNSTTGRISIDTSAGGWRSENYYDTKYALIGSSGGITSLNGLTGSTQTFATGTTGTDFGISSSGTTHTFNLPTASGTNRGALSSSDWTTFNNKLSNITGLVTAGTGISITGSGTSGTPYVVTSTSVNSDSTAAHLRKGTYSQRPLNPKHGAIFLQTDGWEGNHIYDSVMGKWQFHAVPSQIDIEENFHAAAPNLVPKMSTITSGTGATTAIIREKKYGSFLRLSTGTTSSGYATFDFQEAAAMTMAPLDSMIIQRQWWVTLDTLSDATNSYQVAIGYLAHQNLWTFSSCIFFYTHSTNSGNWTTRTRKFDNSSNMTNKDTGVPAVFGVRTKLAFKINGYTQTIYFYINDVLVTTHSTAGGDNIPMPNASSVSSQYNGGIYKTAGTVNRNLIVDEVLYYTIKREY